MIIIELETLEYPQVFNRTAGESHNKPNYYTTDFMSKVYFSSIKYIERVHDDEVIFAIKSKYNNEYKYFSKFFKLKNKEIMNQCLNNL